MISVMFKSSMMAELGGTFLAERIPANVSDPRATAKAKALAKEFVETSAWAKAQGKEFDIDALVVELLKFGRAKGYDLLDEPPGCYLPAPGTWIKTWGPEK